LASGVFVAAPFLAGGFVAAPFFAGGFVAAAFFVGGFVAAPFFAGGFVAAPFVLRADVVAGFLGDEGFRFAVEACVARPGAVSAAAVRVEAVGLFSVALRLAEPLLGLRLSAIRSSHSLHGPSN